jgi:putative oxidoreductase
MDAGLLIIRGAIGLILLANGVAKIGGRPALARAAVEFGRLGLRPAGTMAMVAGGLQVISGLLFCAGVLTVVAAGCGAVTMAVAIRCVAARHGLTLRGCEYPGVLLLTCIGLACSGPGNLSLARYVAASGGSMLAGVSAATLAVMAVPAARITGLLRWATEPRQGES